MELEALERSGRGDTGVSALMNRNFLIGAENEPLAELLERMAQSRVARAVIMKESEPVGVVRLDQVLKQQNV